MHIGIFSFIYYSFTIYYKQKFDFIKLPNSHHYAPKNNIGSKNFIEKNVTTLQKAQLINKKQLKNNRYPPIIINFEK